MHELGPQTSTDNARFDETTQINALKLAMELQHRDRVLASREDLVLIAGEAGIEPEYVHQALAKLQVSEPSLPHPDPIIEQGYRIAFGALVASVVGLQILTACRLAREYGNLTQTFLIAAVLANVALGMTQSKRAGAIREAAKLYALVAFGTYIALFGMQAYLGSKPLLYFVLTAAVNLLLFFAGHRIGRIRMGRRAGIASSSI